jgi:hypothetical protein
MHMSSESPHGHEKAGGHKAAHEGFMSRFFGKLLKSPKREKITFAVAATAALIFTAATLGVVVSTPVAAAAAIGFATFAPDNQKGDHGKANAHGGHHG